MDLSGIQPESVWDPQTDVDQARRGWIVDGKTAHEGDLVHGSVPCDVVYLEISVDGALSRSVQPHGEGRDRAGGAIETHTFRLLSAEKQR